MARRTVLTGRQRDALLALPADEPTLLQHHVFSDVDLNHIRRRRRPQNRLGFALQLCAFRYPGRLLQPGEVIPEAMLAFIGGQRINATSGVRSPSPRPTVPRSRRPLRDLCAVRALATQSRKRSSKPDTHVDPMFRARVYSDQSN
jgi:Domain of unknown function (DUF4158)